MYARAAVIAACSVGLILQGCATASKDLTATYVSPLQYQAYDCDQLRAEAQRIQGRVVQLGGRLDEAANNDKGIAAVGIILFWPALFALGGTKQEEAEYSRLKGEYDAVEQQAILKKCQGIAPSATMATTAPRAPTAPPVEPAIARPAAATAAATEQAPQPSAQVPTPIRAPVAPQPAPTPTPSVPQVAEPAPVPSPAPALTVQPVGLKQASRHQFSAERFAKENGCASPAAAMTIKQFESETFTVNCADGNAMIVRCEGSTCRTLQ